eukprot:CCRYP_017176-RA/>CCRYP_017176-RA protein AED:0.08 eAED:1.00 QI:0/-1/0/1/-1/0/1/0/71
MLSMSSTTMQTTAASPTMPSLTTASHGNNSPIAGSMPTSKTAWQREPSETSLKAERSNIVALCTEVCSASP